MWQVTTVLEGIVLGSSHPIPTMQAAYCHPNELSEIAYLQPCVCSVMSNSLWPHGLLFARLLYP